MAVEFRFPDVGEGIAEGEIVKWRVREGDSVSQDQVLCEVETDKAVVELPSPVAGTVLRLHHREGDMVKVGEVLVTLGEKGEKVAAAPQPVAEVRAAIKEPAREAFGIVGCAPEEITLPPTAVQAAAPRDELLILPAVRRLARERGVDVSQVKGTGQGGRITEEDVRQSATAGKPAKAAEPAAIRVTKKYDLWGYVERVPLRGIRRATAQHMEEAVRAAALVTHMDECDVSRLSELREREKGKAKVAGVHLTFMPFIIKAVVQALKKHPSLNASLEAETGEIVLKKYYNIGVAVDADGGLLVPVVKGADQKGVLDLGKEIQEMADRVRKREIDLADLKGGTFTITNVGALGGIFATPIPNHPEAAILATGRILEKPVAVGGRVEVRSVLPLSLTFDHRVLDGAEAARFMNTLKGYLEDPDALLVGT